jgi:sugar phosphate isomerase/epimerase
MLLFHTENIPHYGLERTFEFAKKAGYAGIELCVTKMLDTQNPKYLKMLEKRYDIKIKAFSILEKYEETHIKAFQETVREFPGTKINLNSPQVLSSEYKKWMNNIAERLAKKYGLILCHKNTPIKTVFGFLPQRPDNSVTGLKKQGLVCLDLTALAVANEEIMRAIKILGNSLKHVYLSNLFQNRKYSLPQKGILPVESFLTKLAKKNWQGDFTLRVSAKQLFEGDEEKMIEQMIECRKFYEEYFENIIKKN